MVRKKTKYKVPLGNVYGNGTLNLDYNIQGTIPNADGAKIPQVKFDNSNVDKASVNTEGLLRAASTAVGLLGNAANQAKINTGNIKKDILSNSGKELDSSSFDALLASKPTELGKVNANMLRGNSVGQDALNALGAGASGALAGASTGGLLGAGIGAGVGLLSSVGGSIFGRHKANKQARQYNKLIAEANARNEINFLDQVDDLNYDQMSKLNSNYVAFGGAIDTNGTIFPTGLNIINNGGTHEENPYGGVFMGTDSEGVPNLLEQGEVQKDNYVYSDRITIPKLYRDKLKLGTNKKMTFADGAKKIAKLIEDNPNDTITKETANEKLNLLAQIQEAKKLETQLGGLVNIAACGGRIKNSYPWGTSNLYRKNYDNYGFNFNYNPIINTDFSKEFSQYSKLPTSVDFSSNAYTNSNKASDFFNIRADVDKPTKKLAEWPRYIPAVGFGIGAITDAVGLTNKPKYDFANNVEASIKGGTYKPVEWNPIGNQLGYKPADRDYYLNKLLSASEGQRRGLLSLAGGNRGLAMANTLTSDANTLSKFGDTIKQIEAADLAQRKEVESFNSGIAEKNSTGMLQAAMANQNALASLRDYKLRGILEAARLKQEAYKASEDAKSANLSGLFQTLGDIGYENKNMNMIRGLYASGAIPRLNDESAYLLSLLGNKRNKNKGR